MCSTLTSVVVWNRMSLHLSLSFLNMAVPLINIGVNDLAFLKGITVQEETNWLANFGVWNRNTCYLATPIPISPKFGVPLVDDIAFFVGLANCTRRDKQASVGVRNSNICSLVALIPISPKFR